MRCGTVIAFDYRDGRTVFPEITVPETKPIGYGKNTEEFFFRFCRVASDDTRVYRSIRRRRSQRCAMPVIKRPGQSPMRQTKQADWARRAGMSTAERSIHSLFLLRRNSTSATLRVKRAACQAAFVQTMAPSSTRTAIESEMARAARFIAQLFTKGSPFLWRKTADKMGPIACFQPKRCACYDLATIASNKPERFAPMGHARQNQRTRRAAIDSGTAARCVQLAHH